MIMFVYVNTKGFWLKMSYESTATTKCKFVFFLYFLGGKSKQDRFGLKREFINGSS